MAVDIGAGVGARCPNPDDLMPRQTKSIKDFFLPPSPIPRAGDRVVWYADNMKMEGVLLGHRPDGKPCVRNMHDNETTLPSFDSLRLLDPSKPTGPNWTSLPPQAIIRAPEPHEVTRFTQLLGQRTPPGPRYADLVEEIWARGFEVFMVGGTVRDVISGFPTNDVDLVTTMPLARSVGLLKSMYRYEPSIDQENGFVRLGGTPGSGDPFIDLKMFSHYLPGTEDAIFGSDFSRDVAHRDFACNAIYYDPVNQALLDPTGTGIEDAEERVLTLVCDTSLRSSFHCAQILIRFFKFLARGFLPAEATARRIREEFVPTLPAMKRSIRIGYLRTQVLSKRSDGEREEALEEIRVAISEFGEIQLWVEYIEPLIPEILQ